MSIFLGGGNTLTTVMLQGNDARIQLPTYQFDYSGKGADLKPWADGMLWPRSRFGGSDSAGILLGNDYQSTGRFENDQQDVLGGAQAKKIIGQTLDSTGSPLGSCVVEGFVTATDVSVGKVTSDTAGYYELPTNQTGAHYLVAYKAGSPDVAGTTVNTITPT